MIKTVGFFLIITACSCYGFISSNKLKLRIDCLEKFFSALIFLENEVSYGKNDIFSILTTIGKTKKIPWLLYISKDTDKTSINEIIYDKLSSSDYNFSNSDKQVIKDFLSDLGSLDTIAQLKSIAHIKKQILLAKEDALANYSKLGKLYRSMGILCGLLFSILLY